MIAPLPAKAVAPTCALDAQAAPKEDGFARVLATAKEPPVDQTLAASEADLRALPGCDGESVAAGQLQGDTNFGSDAPIDEPRSVVTELAEDALTLIDLLPVQVVPGISPVSVPKYLGDGQAAELSPIPVAAADARAVTADRPLLKSAPFDLAAQELANEVTGVTQVSTTHWMATPSTVHRPPPGLTSQSAPASHVDRNVPMHSAIQLLAHEIVSVADSTEISFGVRPATLGPVAITIGRAEEGRTLNLGVETPQAVLVVQQAEMMLNRQNAGGPFVQVSVDLNSSARDRGAKSAPPPRVRELAQTKVIEPLAPAGRFA